MATRKTHRVFGFRAPQNQRRERPSIGPLLESVNPEPEDQAGNRRYQPRSVQTQIADANEMLEVAPPPPPMGFWQRVTRYMVSVPLLLVGWITWWALMEQFAGALHESFWLSKEFWCFASGMLLMGGWFASGLFSRFFMAAYVLGHELTHACFVMLCAGRVTRLKFNAHGGYILTTKTNLLIALSPYFVPLYSVLVVSLHGIVQAVYHFNPHLGPLSEHVGRVVYLLIGATWTFHMAWTVCILPKDQPDLREHGTWFSLVLIFVGNLVLLSLMLCLTRSGNVPNNFANFAYDWLEAAGAMTAFFINALVEFLAVP